jgi:hypothetical protein
MTPKEIMQALKPEHPNLQEALDEAVRQQNEVIPLLLQSLKTLRNSDISNYEDDTYVAAAYLLANFKEPNAFAVITDLIRYNEDDLEVVWGDILTEDICPILRDTFNGELWRLKEIAENPYYSLWARSAALQAFGYICYDGKADRQELIDYIRALIKKTRDIKYDKYIKDVITCVILHVILDQRIIELKNEVKEIYSLKLVDFKYYGNYDKFLNILINDAYFSEKDKHISNVAEKLKSRQWFKKQ